MNRDCIQNLNEIKLLLTRLSDQEYAKPLEVLSNASLGQHVRHIIELYQALIHGIESGVINYDNRKRDISIESQVLVAKDSIDALILKIDAISENKAIELKGNFSISDSDSATHIQSTLFRELAYNLEHSIHHQALLKIGLKDLGLQHLIHENFGVAAATIRFKSKPQQASS
ncbi:MAG: DinB family protein [Bacteroidia bacterium]